MREPDVSISFPNVPTEIGRAQALQAQAAGAEPLVEMNPILIKPVTSSRAEMIVLERVVRESLARLRREADVVFIEGAGSPAEINLRDTVNMAVARHTGAPVLSVVDIDRGGALAALYGLPDEDRARLAGSCSTSSGVMSAC